MPSGRKTRLYQRIAVAGRFDSHHIPHVTSRPLEGFIPNPALLSKVSPHSESNATKVPGS
jgi:hypothetical protein